MHTHCASMKLCVAPVKLKGSDTGCNDCTLCSPGMLYRGEIGDLGVIGGGRERFRAPYVCVSLSPKTPLITFSEMSIINERPVDKTN